MRKKECSSLFYNGISSCQLMLSVDVTTHTKIKWLLYNKTILNQNLFERSEGYRANHTFTKGISGYVAVQNEVCTREPFSSSCK